MRREASDRGLGMSVFEKDHFEVLRSYSTLFVGIRFFFRLVRSTYSLTTKKIHYPSRSRPIFFSLLLESWRTGKAYKKWWGNSGGQSKRQCWTFIFAGPSIRFSLQPVSWIGWHLIKKFFRVAVLFCFLFSDDEIALGLFFGPCHLFHRLFGFAFRIECDLEVASDVWQYSTSTCRNGAVPRKHWHITIKQKMECRSVRVLANCAPF
jgi:hypothetical protein